MSRKPKSESLDADLAASVKRGLSDIENGRYHPFDAEKIRSRANAELEAEIAKHVKGLTAAAQQLGDGIFDPDTPEEMAAKIRAGYKARKARLIDHHVDRLKEAGRQLAEGNYKPYNSDETRTRVRAYRAALKAEKQPLTNGGDDQSSES